MLKNYAKSLLGLLVVTLIFSSCAHSPHDAVKKVQIGMTKADVLEIMGNPKHTGRKLNADVWLYVYGDGANADQTEIFFQEGKVLYVGEPKTPRAGTPTKDVKNFRPIGE